ncbi:MAG TPA: erythromycin esterase family protein [Acidobacteriaceae bacterium]|nr:erythromycin esterase family protein [Acidobacteriaceae bacterium]
MAFGNRSRFPSKTQISILRRRWLAVAASCLLTLFGVSDAGSAVGPKGQPVVLPFASRSIPSLRQPTIIAVGEASHGGQPMLLARNRLIHELAEKGRISWVALETGYAEALLLDRFVKGGPGIASDVAAKGFTWGFGNLAGNIALLADLRALNAGRPAGKQIGIVGIDLSLGGPLGSAPMMSPVECALNGVHDAALRESLRTSFSKAVIPGLTQVQVSEEAKTTFRKLSEQLTSSIDPAAPESTHHCALIVTQSAADFDVLPTLSGEHGIPPDAWRCLSKRDEAMAANALTALAHAEGRSILLFAHTSHVLSAPILGGRFSGQQQPPQSMGETLRRALGNRYVVIAEIEPVKPAPASAPPDLYQLLHPACDQPCMMSANGLQWHQVRIGINGDDQQLVDPTTAASFYLIIPDPSSRAN